MRTTCACGAHQVETEHATYVRNGVPLCPEWTCQKVKEHMHLRRAPHFDDIEHDDQVPTHIHARSNSFDVV